MTSHLRNAPRVFTLGATLGWHLQVFTRIVESPFGDDSWHVMSQQGFMICIPSGIGPVVFVGAFFGLRHE